MPSCQARAALANLEFAGQLSAEALYDLVLAATGDPKEAARCGSERSMARLRAGLPV